MNGTWHGVRETGIGAESGDDTMLQCGEDRPRIVIGVGVTRLSIADKRFLAQLPPDLEQAGWELTQAHVATYVSGSLVDASYRTPNGIEHWNYTKITGRTVEEARENAIASMRTSQQMTDARRALDARIQPTLDSEYDHLNLRIVHASFNQTERVYVIEMENPMHVGSEKQARHRAIDHDLGRAIRLAVEGIS